MNDLGFPPGRPERLKIEILSLSASDPSVSRVCALRMHELLAARGAECVFTDIRDLPAIWPSHECLDDLPEAYRALKARLWAADGVYVASPVHGYSVSAPAKALVELIGETLYRKPCAFLAAAGSQKAWLAVSHLMASLLFERQTLCMPSHIMATGEDLTGGVPTADLERRMNAQADLFVRFAAALGDFTAEARLRAT